MVTFGTISVAGALAGYRRGWQTCGYDLRFAHQGSKGITCGSFHTANKYFSMASVPWPSLENTVASPVLNQIVSDIKNLQKETLTGKGIL